jgi:predicted neuraminidase
LTARVKGKIQMKYLPILLFTVFLLETAVLKAQPAGLLRDLSLQPPEMITSPLAKYSYDSLNYGMNMGIEKTPCGRFWMCWTGGGDNPESFMLLASSDDQGRTWSAPRLVVDGRIDGLSQSRTVQNGNLWTDPSGNLWFFFDQSMMDFDGQAGVWYTICQNPDASSPKWTPPKRLWHGTAKSKPIILKNGDWIWPVSLLNRKIIYKHPDYLDAYHELDSLRKAHVFASSDKGKTWVRRGGVRFPNPSFDEHHVLELRDGRLWMTARTNKGIWQSFSSDGGVTWIVPEKFLEHVSSRHFIRRLLSGNILLVKHGTLNEQTKKRSHLYAYLSEDDGRTWKGGLLLDEREGISYPDGFQDDDGTIYVTYDFMRSSHGHIYMMRFTEGDILNPNKSGGGSQRTLIYQPLGIN